MLHCEKITDLLFTSLFEENDTSQRTSDRVSPPPPSLVLLRPLHLLPARLSGPPGLHVYLSLTLLAVSYPRSWFFPDVSMSLAVDSAVSFLLFVGRCSSPCRRAASIGNRLLVLVISCMHPMEKGRRNHSCSGTRVAIIHPKTSRIRMQPLGTFFLSLSNIFLSRTMTYLHLRSFLAANLLSEASGHAI